MTAKKVVEAKDEGFKQWCVLELMGHRKLAGLVSEEARFGTVMCRIDVPQGKGFVTQHYGGSSIYACTPTTEEICRAFAKSNVVAPVSRYELPQLPAPRDPMRDAAPDDDDAYDPTEQG